MAIHIPEGTTFTVCRFGEFTCAWQLSDTKCGIGDRTTFRYELKVKSTGLDKQGFVADNREIQSYFERLYGRTDKVFVSCERMCLQALKDFQGKFAARGQKLIGFEARIWGAEQSYAELVWPDPLVRRA